jgi:hypothetical protein
MDDKWKEPAMQTVNAVMAGIKGGGSIAWGSRDKERELLVERCEIQEGLVNWVCTDFDLTLAPTDKAEVILEVEVELPPQSFATLRDAGLLSEVLYESLEGITAPRLWVFNTDAGLPEVFFWGLVSRLPLSAVNSALLEAVLADIVVSRTVVAEKYRQKSLTDRRRRPRK